MMLRLSSALVLLGFALSSRAAVLVPGFSETAIPVPGVSQTTDIEWAPDTSKRLFLAQKDGTVRVVQDGTLLPQPFAVLSPVYTGSECGLIGMCFHPNYLMNRFIYFFVTVSASEQQIIRCQESPTGAHTFQVLLGGLPTLGADHDGGGLAVGLDGKLYFSIGDLGPGVGVNTDLSSLASKVGRCNLNGSVMAFNPHHDGAGPNNDYIYAKGFRNPFKIAVQPTTGLLWVNATGAEYEQIFAVDKGDHGGWNLYDNTQPNGFISPRVKYRTNGTDTRQIAAGGVYWHSNLITITTTVAHGFRPGERVNITGVFEPTANGVYFIETTPTKTTFTVFKPGPHIVSTGGTVTTFPLGGAVTGGCFYNSGGFPGEYRQNYFFCDLNSGRINRVTFDATNEVTSVEYFVNGVSSAVDAATGPEGDLYYAGFGNQTIYRLTHTNNPQRICVTPQFLNIAEGGVGLIHVRLTSPPAGNVVLDVAKTSGSAGISTTNVSLVFTPGNYNDTQAIFIRALADADRAHSQAAFTLSCPGFQARGITINAYDVEFGQLAFNTVLRTNNVTRFQVATERKTRVALDASTNLITWQPLSTNNSLTNTITLFDSSPVRPHRFYRSRVAK
jgi:glucose/arabinose dehydrogenase